jgi:hypothetical protein
MVANGVYRYCYLTLYKRKRLADIPLEVTLLTKTVKLKTETHSFKPSLEPGWNELGFSDTEEKKDDEEEKIEESFFFGGIKDDVAPSNRVACDRVEDEQLRAVVLDMQSQSDEILRRLAALKKVKDEDIKFIKAAIASQYKGLDTKVRKLEEKKKKKEGKGGADTALVENLYDTVSMVMG